MELNSEVKVVANKRRRPPRHKIAFWIGMCLGLMGLLTVMVDGLAAVGQMSHSQALGLTMIIGAFALFGIAWHLAGDHLGVAPTSLESKKSGSQ